MVMKSRIKIIVGYCIALILGGFLDEFLREMIAQSLNAKGWIILIRTWSLCDWWITLFCLVIFTIIIFLR